MTDLSPGASYGGILGMDDALIGGAGNPALSMISGDFMGLGVQVLGGILGGSKTNISGAATGGQSGLNTSGWAMGDGTAQGADLSQSMSMQSMQDWPWYIWAAGTLVIVAIIKKAV